MRKQIRNLQLGQSVVLAWKPQKIDLHGASREQAEKAIDHLAVKGGVWEIVTGHGKGIIKSLLKELQKVYHFTILSTSPNNAAMTVDFG